ncbi:MAG: O-antigen ligase family protein [Vicinamibacterales bacterium]
MSRDTRVAVANPRDRVRQLAAAAGWIALILPLALVLLSIALAPVSNWTVRTTLAGFCILAIARPDAALLVTTALLGFGIILSHLVGVPTLRVTEALVVASLAGYGVWTLRHGADSQRALSGSMSVPIVLFAIAAAASAVVWQWVYLFEMGYPSDYVQALVHFLSRDYFVQPGNFAALTSTAVILEGLALYVVVAALCQVDPTFFERALRMLTLGGAGLAVLSVVRLGEILLRNPGAIEALRATSVGLRISPQIPDYIAAGSYFALCWLVALGVAIASRRSRLAWVVAGVPLILAIYLTGSRSVIAAALVGLVVLGFIVMRQKIAAVRGVVSFAVVAFIVMVLSYSWMAGRDFAGEMARQSLIVRGELVRAGVRVIATRPLFGIGLYRFFLLASEFASPELRALWQGRMNPHNDFLRFGAELGLVGLTLFIWILVGAGRRTWAALQGTRDARLAGVAAGLVAFLVTSLVSNPLMVREVSYLFWIALGLAVGHSASLQVPRQVSEDAKPGARRARRVSRLQWTIASLLGGLLVFSIPFRARQELATVDLTRVSYGLFEWAIEPDGTRLRWSGPRATFFVDGRAHLVEIPLSGIVPLGVVQQVEVRVDGRLANRIAVGREWQRLRTLLPPSQSTTPHRIDLRIFPSWVPADVIPGNQDRRVFGVKVGEINVIGLSNERR